MRLLSFFNQRDTALGGRNCYHFVSQCDRDRDSKCLRVIHLATV
jgi:hypothetical protein